MTAALLLLCLAQAPPFAPPPAAASPPSVRGRRLLVAAGLQGGGGEGVNVGGFGFGAYFRVGEQLDDAWGLGPELSAGTIVAETYARAAFTVDYTPVDAFTVGAGPAARFDMGLRRVLLACPGSSGGCAGLASNEDVAGTTVRLDLHLGPTCDGRRRRAFTVSAESDLGAAVGENAPFEPGFAWGVYLDLGYAWY